MNIKNRLLYIGMAFCLLIPLACAQSPVTSLPITTVNSFADPEYTAKRSYVLLSGQDRRTISPETRSSCTFRIHAVLQQQGFVPAAGYHSAEILIFYSFKIGKSPIGNYGVSVPNSKWSGIESPQYVLASTAMESTIGSSRFEYLDSNGRKGRLLRPTPEASLHDAWLTLRAYDHKAWRSGRKLRPVWVTRARYLGPSDRPEVVFLALLGSAEPCVARNAISKKARFLSKSGQ